MEKIRIAGKIDKKTLRKIALGKKRIAENKIDKGANKKVNQIKALGGK